jgi:predicted dinucleotide-utilizing enzyme
VRKVLQRQDDLVSTEAARHRAEHHLVPDILQISATHSLSVGAFMPVDDEQLSRRRIGDDEMPYK